MSITLDAIRICFEGVFPGQVATCAPDGTPNVAWLSQVHYVDGEHIALSFQFFNKTRENVLANPRAVVQVLDHTNLAHYHLHVQYLRTETAGPLFEYMKAKLAGLASHAGMSNVFRLRGADVYRVLRIECAFGLMPVAPQRSALTLLRACTRRLNACTDLAALLDESLSALQANFGVEQSMLLMVDETGQSLYTVASRGYPESGIGSEIRPGEGIIGVAARERTPIRIGHLAREYIYAHALSQRVAEREKEIPFPGSTDARSQLAVPIVAGDRLLGVLYAESPHDTFFTFEHEDAAAMLSDYLASAIVSLGAQSEAQGSVRAPARRKAVSGAVVTVRHYAADDSVFIDNDYMIKGVAGAIFWKLLEHHVSEGRTEFTNRELRLDPSLRLPEISDNLEARLILLQRRLSERCAFIAVERAGRGRFTLRISRPLRLEETPASTWRQDRPASAGVSAFTAAARR